MFQKFRTTYVVSLSTNSNYFFTGFFVHNIVYMHLFPSKLVVNNVSLTIQKYEHRNKKIYVQRKKIESYTALEQNP